MGTRSTLILWLAVILPSMTACRGQSPVVAPVSAPGISVQITGEYCPSVEIQPGMQIMWTNADRVDHTLMIERTNEQGVVMDTGGTDLLQPGDSFSISLNEAGLYTYYWSKDRTSFGTIVVLPASYPYP